MAMEDIVTIVAVAMILLSIAGTWRIFEKADKPGWAAIVSIYNTYVMTKAE